MEMDAKALLNKIVRVGSVSSVDIKSRTVRVAFADKTDGEGNPLISAPLKVIQNQPLITVENWVEEEGSENKWDFTAEYNSHDRSLGLGETYVKKAYSEMKDVITNEKIIKYEKRETIPVCAFTGVIENKKNKQVVTVYPWLPYIGQFVVCLYLPNGESDGFVLGGI